MRASASQYLWFSLFSASLVSAVFEEFSFAGDGGNSSAANKCPNEAGSGANTFGCDPPSVCTKDTLNSKWYCCVPGVVDAVCWTSSWGCTGAGGSASAQQLSCGGDKTKFCCQDKNERCTERYNQINICWSNSENPLRNVNKTLLNDTYKSMSSAKPSATVYSIPKQELNQLTISTPGTSSATSSPTVSPSPSPAADSDSGLSGGAIGGIVGGVVGGLALLGAIGFFLWRRRKNSGKTDPHAQSGDPYQGYGYQQQQYQPGHAPSTHTAYSPQSNVAQMHQAPPMDKYAHMQQPQVAEAPAYNNPVEMDASYYQQTQGSPHSPQPKPGQTYH